MKQLIWIFAITSFVVGCSNQPHNGGDSRATCKVDTIVYEALIHNIDPSEPWKNEWLKHLDREVFINDLFTGLYSKKIKAVDYFSKEPMSIEQIKEWESNNPRSAIGKLQFTERWVWFGDEGRFEKEVIAILPAYESFTDNGSLRGYKAGLQIILKE